MDGFAPSHLSNILYDVLRYLNCLNFVVGDECFALWKAVMFQKNSRNTVSVDYDLVQPTLCYLLQRPGIAIFLYLEKFYKPSLHVTPFKLRTWGIFELDVLPAPKVERGYFFSGFAYLVLIPSYLRLFVQLSLSIYGTVVLLPSLDCFDIILYLDNLGLHDGLLFVQLIYFVAKLVLRSLESLQVFRNLLYFLSSRLHTFLQFNSLLFKTRVCINLLTVF